MSSQVNFSVTTPNIPDHVLSDLVRGLRPLARLITPEGEERRSDFGYSDLDELTDLLETASTHNKCLFFVVYASAEEGGDPHWALAIRAGQTTRIDAALHYPGLDAMLAGTVVSC